MQLLKNARTATEDAAAAADESQPAPAVPPIVPGTETEEQQEATAELEFQRIRQVPVWFEKEACHARSSLNESPSLWWWWTVSLPQSPSPTSSYQMILIH